jgi:hypothetical protein
MNTATPPLDKACIAPIADSRDARLKAALRANLLRRKQQHNARQQQDPTTQPQGGADVDPS